MSDKETKAENIWDGTITINFSDEITYGEDQVFNSYPARFPTVGFKLIDTTVLCAKADDIRIKAGFKPMFTGSEIDENGWYDFYVGLNGYSQTYLDSCIDFVVVNTEQPDNEETYHIYLTEDEQKIIYKQLNEQCKQYLDKSCMDLLEEARQTM